MVDIPREVADAEGVPEDLDSSLAGPYLIPSPRRRRRAGAVYAVGALLAAVAALAGLPAGFWFVALALALIAGYHWVAGWHLEVGDPEALSLANRAVEFPVGHASAAVSFEGWLAKPVWNVLVFSADEPPTQRGLVRIDARTGAVVDVYVEDVPPSDA